MTDFKSISVIKEGNTLTISNAGHLKLIGNGIQGAVFKLNEERCVKVYADESECKMESQSLRWAEQSGIVPHVHEVGPNYIVMEYINGPSLENFLKNSRYIPKHIVLKLLFVFKQMKKFNFTRIDARLRHMIVDQKGNIKVVDHVNSYRKNRKRPFAFFKDLENMNLLQSFFRQLKEIDLRTYKKWKRAWKNRKLKTKNK